MEYLALWMFLAAVGLLLVGFPVAFTLGGTAVLFTLIGSDMLGFLPWDPQFRIARLNILPQRIYGTIMENYTLVAVPFFVFMGVMLEKSGLAEDLLETRSEEHTSELQSRGQLVCRLLLEKKKVVRQP